MQAISHLWRKAVSGEAGLGTQYRQMRSVQNNLRVLRGRYGFTADIGVITIVLLVCEGELDGQERSRLIGCGAPAQRTG
jgi:hypothetical protein